MKTPKRWLQTVTLTPVLLCWLLAACAKKPAPVQEPSMVVAPGDPPRAQVEPGPDGWAQAVVPGPDGQARVLVTRSGISLQRQQNGPLEVLEEPLEVVRDPLDMEKSDWAETLKKQAEGVRWSPRGTRVCLLREYKRGSDAAVFSLTSQPAEEVEKDLQELEKAIKERHGDEFKMGRFYYIALKRWIDEDHLEIEFNGNLIPKVVSKDETSPEVWGYYRGTARVELGAKSGTVLGALKWEPLEKEEVR